MNPDSNQGNKLYDDLAVAIYFVAKVSVGDFAFRPC